MPSESPFDTTLLVFDGLLPDTRCSRPIFYISDPYLELAIFSKSSFLLLKMVSRNHTHTHTQQGIFTGIQILVCVSVFVSASKEQRLFIVFRR